MQMACQIAKQMPKSEQLVVFQELRGVTPERTMSLSVGRFCVVTGNGARNRGQVIGNKKNLGRAGTGFA